MEGKSKTNINWVIECETNSIGKLRLRQCCKRNDSKWLSLTSDFSTDKFCIIASVREDKYTVHKKHIKGIIIHGKENNLEETNSEVDKKTNMSV